MYRGRGSSVRDPRTKLGWIAYYTAIILFWGTSSLFVVSRIFESRQQSLFSNVFNSIMVVIGLGWLSFPTIHGLRELIEFIKRYFWN